MLPRSGASKNWFCTKLRDVENSRTPAATGHYSRLASRIAVSAFIRYLLVILPQLVVVIAAKPAALGGPTSVIQRAIHHMRLIRLQNGSSTNQQLNYPSWGSVRKPPSPCASLCLVPSRHSLARVVLHPSVPPWIPLKRVKIEYRTTWREGKRLGNPTHTLPDPNHSPNPNIHP